MRVLSLIVIALILLSCGSDQIVAAAKSRYPACDILKIDKLDQAYEVTMQCPGNNFKVVKLKENTR